MRIALLVLPLAIACGSSQPAPADAPTASASRPQAAAPGVERVDGAKARQLVASGAQLVDVRSPDEYAQKHVDGAVNVPLDAVASHDFGGKDKPLVLYCSAGHRSQTAAEKLRDAGYTHVYLLGAMSAWDR